jgi:hypothetical protein
MGRSVTILRRWRSLTLKRLSQRRTEQASVQLEERDEHYDRNQRPDEADLAQRGPEMIASLQDRCEWNVRSLA